MRKIILVTSIVAISSTSAFAQSDAAKKGSGFFVEPMVTYEKGTGDIKFPDPFGKADTKLEGFGVGARLGFHIYDSIFIGADGRYSMPRYNDDSLSQKVNATSWNYGPFVGIQTPTAIGLRVWGGYIMDGQLDPDKDKNVNLRFSQGKGYRVGAGIRLGITSVNLEFQDITYDKTKVEEVGIFNTGYSSKDFDHQNTSWVVSVSFPFSL